MSSYSFLENFFLSPFTNTNRELFLFTFALTFIFFAGHFIRMIRVRLSRRSLALSLGGWGSRGKSGTERLKAALLNSMGVSFLSKTTGCEPIVIHSKGLEAAETYPLYRALNKSTIWEQALVLQMARKSKSKVMLWECMALRPELVRVLQESWMRDDLSTITNTFLDHEDIQGPAGVDVATVMQEFVPLNSILVTGEEFMLPYLKEAAARKKTRVVAIDWRDSGRITSDVLERFPYLEHPANLALVIAMGKELGRDEEWVLREVPDFILPDIGALRTYPEAEAEGRTLIFSNGFSANDFFSCLQSYKLVGLDKQVGYPNAEWKTLQ